MIPVSQPSLNKEDIESLNNAIKGGWISSTSPSVKEFEKKWKDLNNQGDWLAVSNGTSAIELALRAHGITNGKTVIVPDITFAATINAVLNVGARPIICPVNSELLICPNNLNQIINKQKVDAIIPVSLYNKDPDFNLLKSIRDQNITVICDWAESNPLSENAYKYWSMFTVTYSLFANKFITTGEGGLVGFSSKEVFERAKSIRDHGMDSYKRYWHIMQGMNCRMTGIQAILGISQLERLKSFIKKRVEISEFYFEHLTNLKGIKYDKPNDVSNPPWINNIFLDNNYEEVDRDKLMKKLLEKGIETRPIFYPLHKMKCYKNYKINLNYDNSYKSLRGISLPTFCDISKEQIKYICKQISFCL